jgi:hypothetical protein
VRLHALIELVERGCPPQLAVRILAPIGEPEHRRGNELDEIALEAADDALMSVLERLDAGTVRRSGRGPRRLVTDGQAEVDTSARSAGTSPSTPAPVQESPPSRLSQIAPSASPAMRRPSAATSAYGIAGSGSGSPPASARHASPSRRR